MTELQVISKVLKEKSIGLLTSNNITEDYFITYPDEYDFIQDHFKQYGNVPDLETFLARFPNFTMLEVNESDQYLLRTFNEEYLYAKTVPVINKLAEIIQTDANEAVAYLQSQMPSLTLKMGVPGTDIISCANTRYEQWIDRCRQPEHYSIPTGFPEIDEIMGGWQCGEEFAVIFARTGQGKSWILIKSLEHAWDIGKRVGLIEPEMSSEKTGYRFDTLNGNISNTSLVRGQESPDYPDYIRNLVKRENPFIVAHPKDFNRKITVTKLRAFCETNQLDILGIDGITYLDDERKQRGDNRTTSLTNISEDIMDLSIQLGIPILVVCQSNREGAKDDGPPAIENIRDSDGIGYNASVIIAARQKGPGIELNMSKNRNGVTGSSILYYWDIDRGIFRYVPDSSDDVHNDEEVAQVRKQYGDGKNVF